MNLRLISEGLRCCTNRGICCLFSVIWRCVSAHGRRWYRGHEFAIYCEEWNGIASLA